MNTKEKQKFCRDLIGSIRADILGACKRMPENWDGIELRQYIADSFAEKAGAFSFRSPAERDKQRLRDYRNECLMRNL